jgi:hypothetical protein
MLDEGKLGLGPNVKPLGPIWKIQAILLVQMRGFLANGIVLSILEEPMRGFLANS